MSCYAYGNLFKQKPIMYINRLTEKAGVSQTLKNYHLLNTYHLFEGLQ